MKNTYRFSGFIAAVLAVLVIACTSALPTAVDDRKPSFSTEDNPDCMFNPQPFPSACQDIDGEGYWEDCVESPAYPSGARSLYWAGGGFGETAHCKRYIPEQ